MPPQCFSRAVAFIAATLVTAPAGYGQTPSRAFDPIGRWQFLHADGTPFTARLASDQSAATNAEGGERGIWRWEGTSVRVIYTDGWDDLLSLAPDGRFVKRGWSPDAERCGPASNQTAAQHLSTDAGPPL